MIYPEVQDQDPNSGSGLRFTDCTESYLVPDARSAPTRPSSSKTDPRFADLNIRGKGTPDANPPKGPPCPKGPKPHNQNINSPLIPLLIYRTQLQTPTHA